MTKPKNDAYAICTAQKKKSGMGHDAWKRCVQHVKNEDTMKTFSKRVKDILEKRIKEEDPVTTTLKQKKIQQKGVDSEDEEEAETGQAVEGRSPEENAAIDKKLLAAKAAADKKRDTAQQVSKIMKRESTGKDKDPVGTEAWKDFWKDKDTAGEKKKKIIKKVSEILNFGKHKGKYNDMKQGGAGTKKAALPSGLQKAAGLGMSLSIKKKQKTEGVQKQARIKLDKYKTAIGATTSDQKDDPRKSPSLHTMHNSPEGQALRKSRLKKKTENIDPDTGKATRASKKTLAAVLKGRERDKAEAEGENARMRQDPRKMKARSENIDDPREPYKRGGAKDKEIGKAKSIEPGKRSPEQQKNYERLRKKYQGARANMNKPLQRKTDKGT